MNDSTFAPKHAVGRIELSQGNPRVEHRQGRTPNHDKSDVMRRLLDLETRLDSVLATLAEIKVSLNKLVDES